MVSMCRWFCPRIRNMALPRNMIAMMNMVKMGMKNMARWEIMRRRRRFIKHSFRITLVHTIIPDYYHKANRNGLQIKNFIV